MTDAAITTLAESGTVEAILRSLPKFRIGEAVEVLRYEKWITEGKIVDIFRGPVTGWTVYVVDGIGSVDDPFESGFYEREVRRVEATA